MPPLAVIVILAFATYRLTRIVTIDKISEPFREAFFNWAYKPLQDPAETEAWILVHPDAKDIPSHVPRGWEIRTWVYDLMTCDQCLGVWFGVGVYCIWRFALPAGHGDVWAGILTVAALCGAQSLMAWVAHMLESVVESKA